MLPYLLIALIAVVCASIMLNTNKSYCRALDSGLDSELHFSLLMCFL